MSVEYITSEDIKFRKKIENISKAGSLDVLKGGVSYFVREAFPQVYGVLIIGSKARLFMGLLARSSYNPLQCRTLSAFHSFFNT